MMYIDWPTLMPLIFAGLMGLKDPALVARYRGKEESELVGA